MFGRIPKSEANSIIEGSFVTQNKGFDFLRFEAKAEAVARTTRIKS